MKYEDNEASPIISINFFFRECAGSNGNSKDKILFCLFDKESVRQPGAKEKKVFV